jgi:hypothetical protein
MLNPMYPMHLVVLMGCSGDQAPSYEKEIVEEDEMESEEEEEPSQNSPTHHATQKIAMSKARGHGTLAIDIPCDPHTTNVVRGGAQGIASNDATASPATTDATRIGPLSFFEAKKQGHGQEIPPIPRDWCTNSSGIKKIHFEDTFAQL